MNTRKLLNALATFVKFMANSSIAENRAYLANSKHSLIMYK